MEQPGARNAYHSSCGSLTVDPIQAKPLNIRVSPRSGRKRLRSAVGPIEVRNSRTERDVWPKWSR